MMWTMGMAMVRTIMVRNRPATDSGTATAMAVEMAVPWSEPPMRAMTIRIADATEASAASGATAAPTLAQPRAIICRVPPRMMPASR